MERLGNGIVRLVKLGGNKAAITGEVQGQSLILGQMNPYRYKNDGAIWFNEYVEGFIELALGVKHTDEIRYPSALTMLRAAVESCLPERLRPTNVPSVAYSAPTRLPDFIYGGWTFVSEELQHDDGYDVWMFCAINERMNRAWDRVLEIRLYINGNISLSPSDNYNIWPHQSIINMELREAWIRQAKESILISP